MHYTALVWAKALWTTVGGKNFPPFLLCRGKRMGKLSIFIDESGDFGEIKERPAYYLVTFVFHDQNKNIDKQVQKLEGSMRTARFLT